MGSMFSIIPSSIQSYLPIVIFFGISLVIAVVAIGVPLFFAENKPDKSKLSPYECGFKEFNNSRHRFDVRFYLVAILFIVFDIEVLFLFPWAVALKGIGLYGFYSMLVFLFILLVAFVYEWRKGALEWD